MSTTETVRAWSTTAATNATADAAIASSDSQSPDTVDNNIRSIMVAVKKQENDTGGALAAGGTANALTVTTGQVLESGQLAAGLRLLLRATADNTSTTVTFAPDGLTAANIKRADGSALAIGSIKSGMYLDLVYNTGSSEWRCANILPVGAASGGGLVLLTSGAASGATLDLVLTTYTGYRGLRIVLAGFIPASDSKVLQAKVSTDGGSSWDASGYSYSNVQVNDAGTSTTNSSGTGGSGTLLQFGSASVNMVGSGAAEGINLVFEMFKQTSTALWTRFNWSGYFIDSTATPGGVHLIGGGSRMTAQDTDGIRFFFSSGNITSGDYAVYGYA